MFFLTMKMKSIKFVIWMLIMFIFIMYMMICIMSSTNKFYEEWLPKLNSKLDSTYFGKQGTTMLIYTFPILLIAVLSSIYLHLGSTSTYEEANSQVLKPHVWNRAMVVNGPLGIVSWVELSFLTMFIGLLIWSFSSYLKSMFANISQQAAHEGVKVWEAKLEMSGLAIGLVGNICLAFLFYPVTRGSSILRLVGLTSESTIKYHIWLSNLVMTIFTTHSLCYVVLWYRAHTIYKMLKWDKVGVSNMAGGIALISGLAMWATSFRCVRRKMFELFYYTHHLYVLFFVFYVFHVGFSSTSIVIPGFYLFFIDRFLRFLQSQQRVRLVSARVLPCKTVELNFAKNSRLRYNPTSIMFVNVPGISKLQWHPFTITSGSNMDSDTITVVVKSKGKWSNELYRKLSSSSSSPMDRIEVSIEGPYGPASTHFLRHDMLVLVSGGSGITPFISIIRELIFISNAYPDKTIPRVLLVCTFKKSVDITMIHLLLPISKTDNIDTSRLQLQIEAYVTREKEPTPNETKLVNTIRFKPMVFDSSISPVLGPKNWVWLAAIISSSFVLFLLMVAILTRYYIFPIDHGTDMMFGYAPRAALNMLFMSISIAVTATAGFLWNKKRNFEDEGKIQSDETSPSSRLEGNDVVGDLESFPPSSFLSSTKVHYGKRPDLKKLLSECEGTSVGVLVSGPKKMRQEVAATSSFGSASNLHFQSISFSW